jgi:hypothetical protein
MARIPSLQDPMLYVIGAELKREPVKIGITACPAVRLAELQTAHYRQLFILAQGQIGGVDDEQRVHELFREQRLRGEWFSRSSEIVSFIGRIRALGVYRAAAHVLKSREAYRPLRPHERGLKQWLISNMQPLGPRPVPPPSTPPLTQADADRIADAVRKAGIRVAESSVQEGRLILRMVCAAEAREAPGVNRADSARGQRRMPPVLDLDPIS